MKLSIVIAATATDPLQNCLRALKADISGAKPLLLVVHADQAELAACARSFAFTVQELGMAPASIFKMRRAGFAEASSEFVASLGERYTPCPGWLTAARECLTWDVLTGPITPSSTLSLVGWSIYLAEYSHLFGLQKRLGSIATDALRIPGGNAVYNRQFVHSIADENEMAFHARLAAEGCRFGYSTQLAVEFATPQGWLEYLAERYQLSCEWGGQLAREHSAAGRLLLALSRLSLPFLLISRRGLAVWLARRYRVRFVLTLPLLVLYSVLEMAGEMTGILLSIRTVDKPDRLP